VNTPVSGRDGQGNEPTGDPPVPGRQAQAGTVPSIPPDTGAARSGRWAALWPAWVDRNLGIVLSARFAMSSARATASVVTALYLTAEGFSAFELGVLFLCVTLVSAAMATAIGMLSDRVGRKPFLVTVPLLTSIAAVAFSVSSVPAALFAFAALGSFGRGQGAGANNVGPYQPAESAFVTEGVPSGARAAAFGRLAFVSSLGAIAGGLLAGLASARPHSTGEAAMAAYRPAFVAIAVLAALAGLVALGLREHREHREHREPGYARHGRSRWPRWPRRSWPALWRFWITNATNGIAIGMIGPFMSYWLFRRYGASPAGIGLLFAVVNVGSLASTLAAAGIARRFGTVRVITAVRGLTGLLLVPMALAPTFWLAGGIYFVRMLVQRVGLPLRQSFTQDMADPGERASVAALSNVPAQGTMAGSQVLAGYLFDEISLAAPFELAAVAQCANAVLYGALFGWRPPHRPPDAARHPGAPATEEPASPPPT